MVFFGSKITAAAIGHSGTSIPLALYPSSSAITGGSLALPNRSSPLNVQSIDVLVSQSTMNLFAGEQPAAGGNNSPRV